MKISMRLAMIAGSLLLVWGTHLIITPSSYLLSEKILTRHARDIMTNISDLTLEQSFNHLYKAKSATHLAKLLLSSKVITNDLQGLQSLERYFFDQLAIYPHLAGIYYGTPTGDFVYVSRNETKTTNGFRTKIIRNTNGNRSVTLFWRRDDFSLISRESTPDDPYDPRQRPWYIKAMAERQIVWTEPYVFYTSRQPGITIAGPSIATNGSIKGIVGVDIDIGELSVFISKLKVGKTGKAFMLNRNGDVIAYPDPAKLQIATNHTSLRLPKITEIGDPRARKAFESIHWHQKENDSVRLEQAKFTTFTVDKERYLAMFTPFPNDRLPWIVGVYVPEDDYLGAIKENRKINIAATIILSLLASSLAFSFARSIMRPITNLHQGTRAIIADDLESTFHVDSIFQELQETADSFTRMQQAVIDSRNQLLEKERQKKRLVNDLHDGVGGNLTNIKLLAEMTLSRVDDQEQQRALANIATVAEDSMEEIRYCMDALEDRQIQWPQFLAELRQYCSATLEPHAIAFSMQTEVEPHALPPTTMIYRNLFKIIREAVTNVVKHAGANRMRLTATIAADRMSLVLTDDGRGFSPAAGNTGRGLVSMQSRVAELGGELTIDSASGTQLSFTFPLRRA